MKRFISKKSTVSLGIGLFLIGMMASYPVAQAQAPIGVQRVKFTSGNNYLRGFTLLGNLQRKPKKFSSALSLCSPSERMIFENYFTKPRQR